MVGNVFGGRKMNQNRLAQKRHRKALRRKNKKYTGPKYSRLEQMLLIAPMLEKAGIQIFGKPEEVLLPERQAVNVVDKDGQKSSTSFTV